MANRKPDEEKRNLFSLRLTDATKAALKAKADKCGLSLSDFIVCAASGRTLPNAENAQTILDLFKVNADLARLGNLLKLSLDDPDTLNNPAKQTAESIIADLDQVRNRIKEKAMKL